VGIAAKSAQLSRRSTLRVYCRFTSAPSSDAIVFTELVRQGYGNTMPTRWSIRREFIRMGRGAPNARMQKARART
jgi:hypothetical protein